MKEQSTKNGILILSIAGILAKLLSLLYVPILQKIIGPEGYGSYQKIYEVFVFIYALTSLGTQTAVSKYVAELSAKGQEKDALRAFNLARNTLFLVGSSFTVALVVFAKPIANLASSPGIYVGLIALAPSIAITAVLSSYRGYLQAKNLMTPIGISQVLEQFFNVLVSLIFAALFIKYGYNFGGAGGTIGTSVGGIIAIIIIMRTFIKNKLDREARKNDVTGILVSNKQHLKTLLSYAFPITLSAGMQNLGAVVDTFIISGRLRFAAGFSELQSDALYGTLGLYKTVYYVPLVIITAVVTAMLPKIIKSYTLESGKELRYNVRMALRITLIIIIPSAFGLSVLSREIYEVLGFRQQGAILLTWGAFVVIFMAIVQTQSAVLQGTNQLFFVVKSLLIGTILKIICNYVLVGIRGVNIYGAVFGGYLCFVVPMFINQVRIAHSIKTKLSLIKLSLKPLISSLFMYAVIFISKYFIFGLSAKIGLRGVLKLFPLSIVILIGVIAYFGMMVILKAITKKDLDAVSPKIYNMLPTMLKRKIK